jgi:hypothetical protein
MNRVVATAVAAVALSACGPMEQEEAQQEELAQQKHALTVSVYCSPDYGFAKCYATPSGGTGPYTYNWASYNQYVAVYPMGSMATFTPPRCGSQFGARVDIYDSAGGYAAGFSYANCW